MVCRRRRLLAAELILDYFDISSPLAEGKHEAEEYHISGNKSEDKQYEIKDNGGGIYSENKYANYLEYSDR